MSGAVLLTGASGFLGMETLAHLIDRGEQQIVLLLRASDQQDARHRLEGILATLYESPGNLAARVQAIPGDLLEPRLGLSSFQRRCLAANVDRIIHCAASISFDLPLDRARAINVTGVARMLGLARDCAAAGCLRRFVHVSTAYVSGRHTGSFSEDDLDVDQRFRNTYERTKHEAERLVRAAEDLPAVIARPSIVVGHHESGWTPAFNVIYWPIRAAERGLLHQLPGSPKSVVDFVPVDYVAEGLLALLDEPGAHGAYHLVAGPRAVTAGELVNLHARMLGRATVHFKDDGCGRELPPEAAAYAPYFDVRCTFSDERARQLLTQHGIQPPAPHAMLKTMLGYAHATRWGKRPMSRQASLTIGR